MNYVDIFEENRKQIDSIYDMVAFSYDLIVAEISDEELFIGEYIITNDEASENNPNISNLLTFHEKIYSILNQFNADMEDCFAGIKDAVISIGNKLQFYGNEKMNKLTPLYFLILAIDRFSEKMNGYQNSSAPLNHQYKGNSLIYLKPCKSLIDDAANELEFNECIKDTSISNCLKNITIVKGDIFSGDKTPTKIFSLYLDDKFIRDNVRKKKLNVAIIPFNGFRITTFSKEAGALFTVKYTDDYGSIYSKRAITLLNRAIDQKANIVIFPEYICNEEIQKNIGDYLKSIKDTEPDKLSELLFVVAGTGWADGNNISKIYDKDGSLIGNHYKRTKYHNDKLIEKLESPGKESLVIDVKGIGRFMPAICRDISDGNDINMLVDSFKPFNILIPAWSKSINIGFNTQCSTLAAKYHSSSILCNSCEPLISDNFRKDHNLVVTPYKNIKEGHSYVTGRVNYFKRNDKCDCNCSKRACVFMITMDYSTSNVSNGEIVTKYEQVEIEID